ncbi:NAD(P)/FAD-dependent oxidoreductase [Loktanella sp. Alg231-35]|uniref:NAD(P)/FAD-dependent oxidoreductase n=1 Tax=Loktanella sp. Alg231-35 TaxID=1922220 RepID=UPI000D56110A|nr:FAD-binding oxidoreductase [Loktanella sp. Alg231-35]
MTQSVVIVGAGIIGAATALQLAKTGHSVRVISAGVPDATHAAFGWVNASFFIDDDHHHLRAAGIAAWHRLAAAVPVSVTWPGCLCWDVDVEATFAKLRAFDYPVKVLSQSQIAALEPSLRTCPKQALFFPNEGAAHSPDLSQQLLTAAQALGVQLINNVTVSGIAMQGDRAVGVETATGVISADQVIVAAGTGSSRLAQSMGATVPLVSRPAYIMRTTPLPPMLDHILATPEGEIRQEPSGQLLMPMAVGHQGDRSEMLTQSPVAAADDAMLRLRGLINGLDEVQWAETLRAERPVPADDLPIVGALAEGLYVAVLHSGITLGPVVAELIATDIAGMLSNAESAMLAPYRPGRFIES